MVGVGMADNGLALHGSRLLSVDPGGWRMGAECRGSLVGARARSLD